MLEVIEQGIIHQKSHRVNREGSDQRRPHTAKETLQALYIWVCAFASRNINISTGESKGTCLKEKLKSFVNMAKMYTT